MVLTIEVGKKSRAGTNNGLNVATKPRGHRASTHNLEGCPGQVLCHVSTLLSAAKKEKSGQGTSLQEIALGALSSHPGSSHAESE